MKIKRSLKFLLSITMICLFGLMPAYSFSPASHNAADIPLKYPVLVESIYKSHQGNRFWQDESLRNEFEKQILVIVAAGINDGLSAHYYQTLQSAAGLHNWQRYERLASDALLFYLAYTEQISKNDDLWLFSGKIGNDIGAPSKKSSDLFFNASTTQARLQYLQALLPASIHQSRLYRSFLSSYQTHDRRYSEKFSTFVKPGERLQQKDLLLRRLQIAGDISIEIKRQLAAQDKALYSKELQTVVRAFQARHGLKADAIIGESTQYWLNISHSQRLRLMALNILRMRLLEHNKLRMVIVNIPDYSMEYWEKGDKILTSKVIVGRVERKTALFSTALNAIVFNPSWYVPVTIMRQDILPKALENNDYLNKNRYEIVPSWHSKKVITTDEIKWSAITIENFPYKLRQKPGKTNALGLYKFNTPNKYAIYLHDTPTKQLFDKQDRAYSSGCIRVQNADKFAQLLMEKSGFSENDYLHYLQQEKTQAVKLKKKITLYTIYQTVWVDEADVMQFRKDIYGYDTLNRDKIPQK